jgi:hypothetical protein
MAGGNGHYPCYGAISGATLLTAGPGISKLCEGPGRACCQGITAQQGIAALMIPVSANEFLRFDLALLAGGGPAWNKDR